MFDKIIKVILTFLLASLLGVAGWFCWTRRDADRFKFLQGEEIVVLDSKTGIIYMLDPKSASWIETHPQTGRSVVHGFARQGTK